MPILTSNYISSWYVYAHDGFFYILESWDEKQIRDTDQKLLVQGSLGTRVMSVGGMKWKVKLESPMVISDSSYLTPISIVSNCMNSSNFIVNSDYTGNFLLESASIQFDDKAILCSVDMLSDVPLPMLPVYNTIPGNWTGRLAKYYDTEVSFGNVVGNILSGTIKVKVDISENYFIGGGQIPAFAIQGYKISGDIKLAVPLDYMTSTNINTQYPNMFIPDSDGMLLMVAGIPIFTGNNTKIMFKEASANATAGKITTFSIDFESYALPNG